MTILPLRPVGPAPRLLAQNLLRISCLGLINVGGAKPISNSLLVFQLAIYSYAERNLGPIIVTRICGILALVVLSTYPLIAKLSGVALTVAVNSASVAKNVFSSSTITGTFILQNRAVRQDQRGTANGIAMTAMSICKAIGPAAAGIIFSWSEKRQDASFLPGTQMVFFILNVVLALGVLWTFKPFLAETQH
ncbi:PREDICTED: protein ZINC INDUCED FACILITATOR-LIKE 1-like [Camelina sativa]|uniref:Protein ZINC INDUCED FACILITATOR-LIKE 1-like n=1 Tax=Camelina sativa TaxID=90675 RepID=A0ABM1QAL2_CAMSA|nr:PREDICTED: protein ZINC INDUCED FACILITATOR-LIKE 1-like [Camelina sativa]